MVVAVIVTAVVTGLIGLGAGGLGGYLLGSPGGTSSSGPRAEQNLEGGCTILERLDAELPADGDALDLSEPLLFELTAAGSSFMAAGRADENYEVPAETGQDLVAGASTVNIELINESVQSLQTECAGR